MELTINVNDSCVKKIKALQRLKTMDADELEMFLAEGLEGVITASIFEELGMEVEDLSFNKIATHSSNEAPRVSRPSNKKEEIESQSYDENQHSLSSDVDETEEEPEEKQPNKKEDDFSFVEQNINNALSASALSDEDLVDESMDLGDSGDDDEPVVTSTKAKRARTAFTKPMVRVSDATYSS
jgi:NACalpha-BTF3-like transcription factor